MGWQLGKGDVLCGNPSIGGGVAPGLVAVSFCDGLHLDMFPAFASDAATEDSFLLFYCALLS